MIDLKPLQRLLPKYNERRYLERKMADRFGSDTFEFLQIMSAFDAARDTHRGEPRRKNEDSRLVHERQMAGLADLDNQSDPRVYIDIALHDMWEDYSHKNWSLTRINRQWGVKVCEDVQALTNPVRAKWMSDHEYNQLLVQRWRIGGRCVLMVKGYDRLHGLLNPWKGGKRKMLKKRDETLRYLIPLMMEFNLDVYPLYTACGMLTRKYGLHKKY